MVFAPLENLARTDVRNKSAEQQYAEPTDQRDVSNRLGLRGRILIRAPAHHVRVDFEFEPDRVQASNHHQHHLDLEADIRDVALRVAKEEHHAGYQIDTEGTRQL